MSRLSFRDSRTGIRKNKGINQDRGEPIEGFQGSGTVVRDKEDMGRTVGPYPGVNVPY